MDTVYLFDVDGTLTPPRMPIETGFEMFFNQFTRANHVYLVSGSDYEKIKEQLPQTILHNCSGVFGCSGAQYHEKGVEVFTKEHRFPTLLSVICETFVDTSPFPTRHGNHIEERPGMLNISVVGRDASRAKRKQYYNWDKDFQERSAFVDMINESTLPYEASAGGEISIDIVPNGWNKSVVMAEILGRHPDAKLVFFGDRICPGGNDEPLAKALFEKDDGHICVPVSNYSQTWEYLETNSVRTNRKAA